MVTVLQLFAANIIGFAAGFICSRIIARREARSEPRGDR